MTAPAVTLEDLASRLDDVLARLDAPAPRFLTVEQAAAYTGLSQESMRRMLSSGKLAAMRPVRGRVLIDKLQLDDAVLSSNGRLRSGRGIRR